MSSKGQVTVPTAIREALGLHTGDRIEFILDDKGVLRLRVMNKGPDAFLDALQPRQPDPAYASDDDAIAAAVVDRDDVSRRKPRATGHSGKAA
jgi:AbrB family looped-hinge helix DNA binding protein